VGRPSSRRGVRASLSPRLRQPHSVHAPACRALCTPFHADAVPRAVMQSPLVDRKITDTEGPFAKPRTAAPWHTRNTRSIAFASLFFIVARRSYAIGRAAVMASRLAGAAERA